MKARDIMTANPACCTPDAPARRAAQLMEEFDCGCIPIVSDEGSKRLVGVVTDRDLALRGIAHGRDADAPVREFISTRVSCCAPDSEIEEVERIMAERHVRRVPVVDDTGCCVGMIAQADLAREAERQQLGEEDLAWVVERVSEPTRDSRTDADVGIRVDRRR
jgi:CBS domain-containing protein